jgi:hypothetical protein
MIGYIKYKRGNAAVSSKAVFACAPKTRQVWLPFAFLRSRVCAPERLLAYILYFE